MYYKLTSYSDKDEKLNNEDSDLIEDVHSDTEDEDNYEGSP